MQKGYFVGLGSNVAPARNIADALTRLADLFGPLEISRIVETAPTARLNGPFLNAVAYLRSELNSAELKSTLCSIETAFGRDRTDPNRGRKDRVIDLDILLEMAGNNDQVAAEAIVNEPYYRPSMLELVGTMGLACSAPSGSLWPATEIVLADVPVGLRPTRLCVENGVQTVWERRAALVTGAAVRLGNAIAKMLARSGYDIALHYNSSRHAAEAAAEEIRSFGVRCELFQQDLGDCAGMVRLVTDVVERLPHLDLLVNSASVYDRARIAETTPEMLDHQWAVNFKAPFFLIKEFASRVEHGSIVNLLDNKIAFNQFQYAAYLGSKKALAELTKMAALEFAPRIRVNGIAPGVVLPPSGREPSYLEWRRQTIPTQKLGNPAQICAAVDTLLRNEFMNGQIVFVDGGESVNFVGRNLDSYATHEDAAEQPRPVSANTETSAGKAA
jgi:2-amino-4-hydroxy-6-hydroxymethyldihydropteridine diphosphokinase